MYTYFTFASATDIEGIKSLDEYLAKFNVEVGGIIPLVALNGLLATLQYKSDELAHRLNPQGSDDFQLYSLPTSFVTRFCAYSQDHLESISSRLASDEYWEMVQINPFDLYGFLLELQNFCKSCEAKDGMIVCAITADNVTTAGEK